MRGSLSLFRRGERPAPTHSGIGELEGLPLLQQEEEPRYWEQWTEREWVTLALYGDGLGRIPDEAAVQLGRDFMVIRPACAILHGQKLLRKTGVRRKARRRSAAELVITEKGLAVLEHQRLRARGAA